jgi:hypothetical protein
MIYSDKETFFQSYTVCLRMLIKTGKQSFSSDEIREHVEKHGIHPANRHWWGSAMISAKSALKRQHDVRIKCIDYRKSTRASNHGRVNRIWSVAA